MVRRRAGCSVGKIHPPRRRPRQPDRGWRGRRAAGLRRQGAGRERHRRRRAPRLRFTSSSAARSRSASRTTAKGWSRRMRGWRSSATRRARSGAPTIWRPSRRSGFAARRCRRSRRCRTSCCARGRAASRRGTEIRVNGGAVASVDRGRRAGGHADRGRRPVLQPAGAPEVPEVRRRRVARRSRASSRSWRWRTRTSASR